jgi:hypothetical protein
VWRIGIPLFFGALVAVTVRLSSPQSETIWTVYETPGDQVSERSHIFMCPPAKR